jgi:hypothetical protein
MDWKDDHNLKQRLEELVTAGYEQWQILLVAMKQFPYYKWR